MAPQDPPAFAGAPPAQTTARDVNSRAFDPKALLARLWTQNLPLMRDRVACLETAAAEARLGPLSPARRTEASDLAHKLAGSLGMFGYPRGTEIARELEEKLEADGSPAADELVRLTAELRSVLPL